MLKLAYITIIISFTCQILSWRLYFYCPVIYLSLVCLCLSNSVSTFLWYVLCLVGLLCMYAKSLQSCPTLCDPVDCSLPGSSVHGILQPRIHEYVAISFPVILLYILSPQPEVKPGFDSLWLVGICFSLFCESSVTGTHHSLNILLMLSYCRFRITVSEVL